MLCYTNCIQKKAFISDSIANDSKEKNDNQENFHYKRWRYQGFWSRGELKQKKQSFYQSFVFPSYASYQGEQQH